MGLDGILSKHHSHGIVHVGRGNIAVRVHVLQGRNKSLFCAVSHRNHRNDTAGSLLQAVRQTFVLAAGYPTFFLALGFLTGSAVASLAGPVPVIGNSISR